MDMSKTLKVSSFLLLLVTAQCWCFKSAQGQPPGPYGGYQASPAWMNRPPDSDAHVRNLIAALKDPSNPSRGEAAAALAALGPAAAAAVPALVAAMGDPNEYVRLEASTALPAIGKEAVPALTKALAAKHRNAQRAAA